MQRIHFMQHWFNLSDSAVEDSLYDSESRRRVTRIKLAEDVVPDETAIPRIWRLVEQHGSAEQISSQNRSLLESRPLFLRSGTIVDTTIAAVPASTR
jgi:IS5 family transposase